MAEKFISINNVIGSGPNGKVLLSDLDLGQNDMARFASLLTSYIKAGDFAADLGSPNWFQSGPSNYNIIPYFDSFENYIDKEILGPSSQTVPDINDITVTGTNFRSYHGGVSAKVSCASFANNNATKFLHSDTNIDDAWITVGASSSTENQTLYYLSGYFWFIGPNNGIKLEIINETEPSRSGFINITSTDVDNANNRWTRFKSAGFHLYAEDLITFKITVRDPGTILYMDALQLEIVVNGEDIKSFIQSGVVITDGSNIRVNSITAKAIAAYTITANKLAAGIGNELDISGNTTITAPRQINNIVPYTTSDLYSGYFEQGGIDLITGYNTISTQYIRTSRQEGGMLGNGFAVVPNQYYIVSLSSDLVNASSAILFYSGYPGDSPNPSNYIASGTIILSSARKEVKAPENAAFARLILKKNIGDIVPEDLQKYYVSVELESEYLSGAKYRFDGDAATFTNGGLIINNAADQRAFTADINGITLYNKDGEAKIYADSEGRMIIRGTLDAVNGNFSGDLKGGTLTIGDIYGGNSVIKADGVDGLWAGNNTFGSAPFRINLAGQLVATGANINGTITTNNITATGGRIAGWDISDYTISKGVMILDASGNNGRITFSQGASIYSLPNSGIIRSSGDFSLEPEKKFYLANSSSSTTIEADNITSSGSFKLNNSPIITEARKASSSQYGVVKIWLDGTTSTLKIET